MRKDAVSVIFNVAGHTSVQRPRKKSNLPRRAPESRRPDSYESQATDRALLQT
jgi:hypothetical protein